MGYDIHNLKDGDGLMLGGIRIPFHKSFVAHSDGDVLIHSLIDALLSASGMRDIGYHFPDTDPQYKDIASCVLLQKTLALISGKINNISSVIIAESPKLSPHIDDIRLSLSTLLAIPTAKIAIAAKTNEGNGDIGAGNAIAAYTTCLLTLE